MIHFREVIFTEPDVLASPLLDTDAIFNVVLQVCFIEMEYTVIKLQINFLNLIHTLYHIHYRIEIF